MAIVYLNGLRGISVFVVILHHVGPNLLDKGIVGVEFFFILSSFFITTNLYVKLSTLQYDKTSLTTMSNFIAQYAVKRIMRVWPLYFLTMYLIRYARWFSPFYKIKNANFSVIRTGLLFEDVFFIFWTIPVEMLYYVIAPIWVIIYVVLKRQKLHIYYCIFTCALASINIFQIGYKTNRCGWCYGRSDPFSLHYGPFLIGSVLAIFVSDTKNERKFLRNFIDEYAYRSYIWNAMSWLNFFIFWEIASHGQVPFVIHGYKPLHFERTAISVGLLIIMESIHETSFSRFLESNALVYLGKISYPVYIYHPIMIVTWGQYFDVSNVYQLNFLVVFTAVALGAIVHHTLEQRVLAPTSRFLCSIIANTISDKSKNPQTTEATLPITKNWLNSDNKYSRVTMENKDYSLPGDTHEMIPSLGETVNSTAALGNRAIQLRDEEKLVVRRRLCSV